MRIGNVNTHPVYTPVPSTLMPVAFGMETFNGSVASQLGVMEDLLFNLGYVAFLSNPLHAIDITPDAEKKKKDCVKGLGKTSDTSCARHVLITQEFQNVDAAIPFHGELDSQVVVAFNQRIYSLEYHDNIDIPRTSARCEELSSGPAAYMICMRNAPDGSIEAAMISCPASLVSQGQCERNTTWKSNRGFTTSLSASFLNATVSYERTDGRVLLHEDQTDTKPTMIDASELLDALTVLLNASYIPPNSSLSNPILGTPTHSFGRLIAGHNYRISKIMETSPEYFVRGTNAIQSILAITLFYCQNGVLGQTVMPFVSNSTSVKSYYSDGAFSKQNDNAYVALANIQYKVKVGRATLIAYTVVGGVTLFVCVTALVIGSLLELVKFDAEPTLWPALDFYTQCRVEDQNGKIVPAHKRVELAWIHDGRQLFKEIEGLRVTRRKRGHGPLPEPGADLERRGDG